MDVPLSDEKVQKIAGFPVTMYTNIDLEKTNSLFPLFSNNNCFLLLYQTAEKSGHWTCVIKHDSYKTIEYFDSYGKKPDNMKAFTPVKFWISPKLCSLLLSAMNLGWAIEYNELHLQDVSPKIATCGRWVGFRLRLKNLPLVEFQQIFKSKPILERDKLIVKLTNTYLK